MSVTVKKQVAAQAVCTQAQPELAKGVPVHVEDEGSFSRNPETANSSNLMHLARSKACLNSMLALYDTNSYQCACAYG